MVLHPPGCGRVGHRRQTTTKGGPPSGPPFLVACHRTHAAAPAPAANPPDDTADNHHTARHRGRQPNTPPDADAAAGVLSVTPAINTARQTTNTHRCSSVQDVRLTRYFTLVIAILSTASCALGARLTSIPGSTSGTADTFQDSRIKRPKPGSSFQVEIASYTGNVTAQVVDLDPEDVTSDQVRELRARGAYPVCYVNVGAWEDWRADAKLFPKEVIGKGYPNLPGAHWLNVSKQNEFFHLMESRIKVRADKGFLGVDADNVDGWKRDTGFRITDQEEIRYIEKLSATAHNQGMAFSLRNNLEQIDHLIGNIDMAIVEDCHAGNACKYWSTVLGDGKAVFVIEYSDENFAQCKDDPPGMTTIRKAMKLDSWVKDCSGKEQP